MGLQRVRTSIRRLQGVQGATGLQWVTRVYKLLPGVTAG